MCILGEQQKCIFQFQCTYKNIIVCHCISSTAGIAHHLVYASDIENDMEKKHAKESQMTMIRRI